MQVYIAYRINPDGRRVQEIARSSEWKTAVDAALTHVEDWHGTVDVEVIPSILDYYGAPTTIHRLIENSGLIDRPFRVWQRLGNYFVTNHMFAPHHDSQVKRVEVRKDANGVWQEVSHENG